MEITLQQTHLSNDIKSVIFDFLPTCDLIKKVSKLSSNERLLLTKSKKSIGGRGRLAVCSWVFKRMIE